MNKERTYIAIDLKSFYASVECVERRLNPLSTNLVVADESRTEKTICLAVSPSLKAYGIAGRARLFEVIQKVRQENQRRKYSCRRQELIKKSVSDLEVKAHPDWEIDYIVAPPRMSKYIEYSTRIYQIYLNYIAKDDIHPYSIDEVFIDATDYLPLYKLTARELAMRMIKEVLNETGVTATAGIGTNLYLCKIAMDIVAKHILADEDGVRIAELDEMSYRQKLWNYKPITKFWRVGRGISERLEKHGIDTMGKIARCSVENEELLYKLFGVNAELLIDHAWGWEPCTMQAIKAYKPETNSISSGQVLACPYNSDKALVVIKEMADALSLSLVAKNQVTNMIALTIGYDGRGMEIGDEETIHDHYGRIVPKHSQGTANLNKYTSSSKCIIEAVEKLYNRIANKQHQIRRLNITACNIVSEERSKQLQENRYVQLDLFADTPLLNNQNVEKEGKERKIQEAMINIKKQFGKNSILKGLNYRSEATAKERNNQIGGHKA